MTTTMNTLNSNTTLLMTNTTSMSTSLCSLSMGMTVVTVGTVGMRWCRQKTFSKGEDLI